MILMLIPKIDNHPFGKLAETCLWLTADRDSTTRQFLATVCLVAVEDGYVVSDALALTRECGFYIAK